MSIRIEKLTKTYGSAVAVDNINLAVATGQMLVLLGPSGCGKTTTMRSIAGLELPDGGRISIGERVVYDAAQRISVPVNKRNTGMVFQSYAIWPHMTVAQNVSYPLEMARVSRAEKDSRVAEILALVGLAGLGDRGASYLSGGQMQRVALARSLVMRPSVLLFDEPLSNLDARLRDHLRVELRELQTRLGITSVYVTHDQREALALADQMAVMQGGRIVQIGDPVSVYRRPATTSVAEFLGYSNVFPATIEAGGPGASVTVALDGQACRLASSQPHPPVAQPISACVRPEDVRIAPSSDERVDTSNPMIGRTTGTVTLASFLGSHMQYRVKVETGQVWEVLSTDLEAPLKIGTPAALDMPASSVLLLARQ